MKLSREILENTEMNDGYGMAFLAAGFVYAWRRDLPPELSSILWKYQDKLYDIEGTNNETKINHLKAQMIEELDEAGYLD